MSCFNFPASPAVGTIFPTPAQPGLPQYKWDGEKWVTTVGIAGTGAVRYDTPQSLAAGEKAQARTNIDAVAKTGDTMTGSLTVRDNPANGYTLISTGNDTNPGYIAFHTPDGTRRGYIGWASGSKLVLNGENGWSWQINGVLNTSSDIAAGGNIWSAATYYFRGNGGMYLSHDGSNFTLAGGTLFAAGSVAANGDVVAGQANAASGTLRFGSNGSKYITCDGTTITVNGQFSCPGSGYFGAGMTCNSVVGIRAEPTGNAHVWFYNENGSVTVGILYWERSSGNFYLQNSGQNFTFRPDGRFATGQGGGYVTRAGMNAGAGANCYNINHTSGQQLWVDLTNMGSFYFVSDYRTKKDIKPLTSMWNAVKQLKPISYTNKDFTPPVQEALQASYGPEAGAFMKGDDIPRIGFLAHELQETLGESAASATKDAPDAIQSPNPLTVIAALTKALQEAMTRIEALEARP